MEKQKLIISYLMTILILCSCQKEVSEEVSNTNTSSQVDVYVAGFISDDANYHYPSFNPYQNRGEHPTYWKNGSPVQLDYGDFRGDDNYKSGRALSIAVSGSNVHVAGYGMWFSYSRGAIPYGTFWKNGIPMDEHLRDLMNLYDAYELTSLAVSSNDTYMVGWGTSKATYWKNETEIALNPPYGSTTLNISATATSIAVSGNDVFVSGAQEEQLSPMGGWSNVIAEYWKNGNQVKLTDGSKNTYTTSIAVSGTDIYVAGSEEDKVAIYWKNGSRMNLNDGLISAQANSIAVSGTDVYVAGTQWDGNTIQYWDGNAIQYYYGSTLHTRNAVAKYWKNGKPVNLTDGSKWAEAKSIAVSGNDVYVAGFEDGVAKYWKNGNPVILGDVSKNSEAYSIFLVKK